jgi:AcrR family transcriptional regulator
MPRTGLTAEQLKEKALDAVIEQMKLVGFNRVRLSDIAKSLDVSHAALYSHFTDKSALFDAVTERWLTRFDREQEELCSEKNQGDARERLMQWFLRLHQMKVMKVKLEPELFKAFNYSAVEERTFIKEHMATMRRQLSTIVKQLADTNMSQPIDIDMTVSLLFEGTASFHHPAMVALHINEDREALLLRMVTTLIDGLSADSSRS